MRNKRYSDLFKDYTKCRKIFHRYLLALNEAKRLLKVSKSDAEACRLHGSIKECHGVLRYYHFRIKSLKKSMSAANRIFNEVGYENK